MFNLLNIDSADSSLGTDGVTLNIDNANKGTFSFNSLLSLGDEFQINNTNVNVFDNFLNSKNISEIDLKHLSSIITQNPTVSLSLKPQLIAKLDVIKADFSNNDLIQDTIQNIKLQLNNLKQLNNKNQTKELGTTLVEKILFSTNDTKTNNQNISLKDKPMVLLKDVTIKDIKDIKDISDKYDLNISNIKITTYDNTNPQNNQNTQPEIKINTSDISRSTSDVLLFKNLTNNKDVVNYDNTIKDIFNSVTKNNSKLDNQEVKFQTTPINSNIVQEVEKLDSSIFSDKDIFNSVSKNNAKLDNQEVKIQTTPINSNIVQEVEESNRFVLLDKVNIETLKNNQSFKDIVSANNAEFKTSEASIHNTINDPIKPINIIQNKQEIQEPKVILEETKNHIQIEQLEKITTYSYKSEPIETISLDNKNTDTLKEIFDLKDKIITKQNHILDDKNSEHTKQVLTFKEVAIQPNKTPHILTNILSNTSNINPNDRVNINIDSKSKKANLVNSLISNSIDRTLISNEEYNNQRITSLMQEIFQMDKEKIEVSYDSESVQDKRPIKVEKESLVLSDDESTTSTEINETEDTSTQQKNSVIDVSKFVNTNQSKELNQIMQRQIINGVYENLRYKLSNFIAPLMKFSLELKPSNLGSIDIDIMVRGSNLQVNVKSNKKVSFFLEDNRSDLEKEFSILGYKTININFEDADFQEDKPKNSNDFNTQKDHK